MDCQVKCDTSCKNSSMEDSYPKHFLGLLFMRKKFCTSSSFFIAAKSVFLR